MKKSNALLLAGLLATATSYASQFTDKQDINCNAASDICVSVNPATYAVHNAVIDVNGKAIAEGKMRHEHKQLDWQFWEDGHYWAGVKNSVTNLDYLHLKVISANGKPVIGGASCRLDFYKGATGNYGINLKKLSDGSIVCVRHG